MANQGFDGLRVLSLESRRSREIGQLIANNGGQPILAPSTREVPVNSNEELKFAAALLQDHFQVVILMTGVGTRALAQSVETACSRAQFAAALTRTATVARGPKPVAALRELGVPVTLQVPEPNTWREILQALDENPAKVPLRGRQVAVQEHGIPSPELCAGLADRGAHVTSVGVYKWELPEDIVPLQHAVSALADNAVDVVLFTSSVQVKHLFQIAESMQQGDKVHRALNRAVIASIGPVTSETLREHGVSVDLDRLIRKWVFWLKKPRSRVQSCCGERPQNESPSGLGLPLQLVMGKITHRLPGTFRAVAWLQPVGDERHPKRVAGTLAEGKLWLREV